MTMEEKRGNEIREQAHIVFVITVTAFSLILILLNVLLGWEKWTIPLCVVAILACITMHITHSPQEHLRIYIYAIIFMIEIFYYSVNVDTIYDSTPVIVIAIILTSMTRERILTWICVGVGYSGMIYHLLAVHEKGVLGLDISNIVRTTGHLLLVAIATLVVGQLVGVVDRMETGFRERIRDLEGASRSASDFLANVSHEIRTPINAVIGLTGVCLEKEDNDEIRRDMFLVEAAGKRVAEQISDILDYSEIDMDSLAVNAEDYMLFSVLNDLVVQLKLIKSPELELVIDVDPALPSVMHTDVGKLKKILWHLIANGLKYTKEGGVYVRISSIEEPYGINLCIEVTDTGIGMNAEEMERITDRFYQANSGRTRSTSGLGLGLSIVSGFVSALRGFMTIDSSPGNGTTIRVSIPQKIVDASECMSVKNREKLVLGAFLRFDRYPNVNVREFYNSMLLDLVSGLKVQVHKVETVENLKKLLTGIQLTHLFVGETEYLLDIPYMEKLSREMQVVVVANDDFSLRKSSRAKIMRKPFYCFPVIGILNADKKKEEEEGRFTCPDVRVLVVDDEPMNLTVAVGIFRRYGMIVTTAASGRESIDLCKVNQYDIVFMDHMMPQMDGVEAMKRIRSEADGRDLPIVALTANAVSTAKEMFLAEGFDGFVAKPVELVELERVLRKVLPKSAIIPETSAEEEDAAEVLPEEQDVAEALQKEDVRGTDLPVAPYERLRELGVDTDKGLYYSQGDDEFYRTLLLQFATDAEKKRNDAARFCEKNDFPNYVIIVHALKSTAKMIGARKLSEEAKALEDAAKGENGAYVHANHARVMEEYGQLSEGILTLYGDADKVHGADTQEPEDETDDILEFLPEEVLEFAPEEVLEFAPEKGDEQV